MFAKELVMYVDYINELSILTDREDAGWKKLVRMKKNLEDGINLCLEIADSKAYGGENLTSLRQTAITQRKRLNEIFEVELVEA